ncbi:MAG: hypothetical protein KF709_07240 [Gemmatimonadaceae bacterium]|nr:hypothetical protein [Gemmatimonadaceae bacterium]
MTAPAAPRQRPPRRPLTGAAWWYARASLAVRRTRGFLRWWLAVGGTIAVAVLLIPVATDDPGATARAVLERAAADSLRSWARLQAAERATEVADSLLREAGRGTDASRMAPATSSRPLDPVLGALVEALATARAQRSAAAYLALADAEAVRYGPRMLALADSLRSTGEESERQRIGRTVMAIADYRRAELESAAPREPAPELRVPAADTAALRAERDRLADSVRAATSRHELSRSAVARAAAGLDRAREASTPISPAPLVLLVLVLGVLGRVGAALLHEMRAPTLASVEEAERSVGASVLSLVRDPLPEGALRFRPRGVDPFRVLYLALTSTGTRSRSVIVAGHDPVVSAAVAARLAVAAAADHRSTLVLELNADVIALSRIFRDHAEPGFTDALAGRFAWRDVARPVGSSDGLNMQMIPAGSTPDAELPEAARATALKGFADFRERHELTIVTVGVADAERARELLPSAPQVLCGVVGITPVEVFARDGGSLEATGDRLHSVVLWDAPLPNLPSRAELAAHLSKRKGRTPGGSFKAVEAATKKTSTGH